MVAQVHKQDIKVPGFLGKSLGIWLEMGEALKLPHEVASLAQKAMLSAGLCQSMR